MTAERTDDRIRYEVSGGIARIRLARSPVDALDLAMVRGVIAALKRAAADEDVRAVVIASAVAKRFCAGLDITELAGPAPDAIRTLVHELYLGLFDAQCELGKASVAAVNGAARGGRMTLAVSCDVIPAGASATFGYPEIDLGVLPAIHFVHLPRIIGRHRAFELLFTGRPFDAEQAAALGLINRVVPDAELETGRSGSPAHSRQNPKPQFARDALPSCARSIAIIDAALPKPSKTFAKSSRPRPRKRGCAPLPRKVAPNNGRGHQGWQIHSHKSQLSPTVFLNSSASLFGADLRSAQAV